METRARPTSRGRARCVSVRMGRRWEQTAAGPRAGACRLRRVGRRCLALPGKGRCRCACSTLFALRAKALQSWRAGFWRVAGKSGVSERFAHQGTFPARRGTGKRASPRKERSFSRTPSPLRSHNEPLPTRNGDTSHLTVKTRPFSRKTFHIYPSMANAAHYKPRLIAPAFRGEHPARPSPAFHAHKRPSLRLSRHRLIPQTIPPGERRALPAPAQGINPLRIPFWGRQPSPRSPHPPKRRRRQVPARGLAAVYAFYRRTETKRSKSAPCSWGGLA